MTSTFTIRTVKDRHIQVPPSSPFFQMPNVFVIPPEEEQFETPPWCYFDAAEASPPTSTQYSTIPDFDSLDLALDIINQPDTAAPVFHRPAEDIVMPKKREKRPRLEYLSDSTVEEFQAVSQTGNDSMVVEVIKVRRSDAGDAGASASKRSKTFKSRASKAFRSIKNVGRSSKPSATDIWPPSAGTQSTFESTDELQPDPPRARNPAQFRRSSVLLSQLFQSPKGRSTHDLASSTETSQPYPDTSPSLDNPPGQPMDTNSDMSGLRTTSPTPSTARTTSSKNRFSILDLHRLFSFSSSPTLPQPMSSPPSASSTPSMSREPSTTSSTSIDTPDTPMDVEDAFHTATATPQSTIRNSSSFRPSFRDSAESVKDYGEGEWRSTLILDEPGQRDIGYEMRLDSLHFDSLSFNPDYF